jgi:AraC-like DNA-binding protein
MKAIPLARSEGINPFVGFLEEIGAPVERLLTQAHLSPDTLSRPRTLFPLHLGLRFVEAAARREGIKDLGLIVGRRTRIGELAPLGRLLSPEMTLGQAIALLVSVIGLFNSALELTLLCCMEKALFSHRLALVSEADPNLFILMLMIDVVRLAAGPRWRPDAVHVPAAHAKDRRAHEAAMELPCLEATDRWTVVLDRSLLNDRLRYCTRNGDRGLGLDELRRSAPAPDFTGSMRQVIGSLLPSGAPGLAAAAAAAGLSPRTLQRRLSDCGRTYSQLLEEARHEAALQLLGERSVKILDVAMDLGYSDPANFTRAFRRWTGSSPRSARGGGA